LAGNIATITATELVLQGNISILEAALTQNVTNLLGDIANLSAAAVKTVNGLPPLIGNIQLAVVSPGLTVAMAGSMITFNNTGVTSLVPGQGMTVSSGGTGVVTVATTAVLTLNGIVPPNTGGQVFLVGASGVGVTNNVTTNTLTFDTSTLVTSISNLLAEDVNQDAALANLTATVAAQQLQIASLTSAEQTVAQTLNGTTLTFNMSITALLSDVLVLQGQVAALTAQLANITSVATPTGTIAPWGGSSTPPSGWLLCDGSSVAIATYNDLYNVIGCKFCGGMTCTMTNFCLPDLRGKIPVGTSSTGGSAFNVPAGTSTVGEEKHTLLTTELPVHTHTISDSHSHGTTVDIPLTDDFITSYWDTGSSPGTSTWTPSSFSSGANCNLSPVGIVTQTINARAGNFDTNSGSGGTTAASVVKTGSYGNCPSSSSSEQGIYFRRGYQSSGTSAGSISAANTGSGVSHNVVQPSVVVAGHIIKL
jgi:microcystin-dependent protein